MIIKKRKGTLAAVLVLLIAIITISTYIMKWVFDRHTTATRLYKSSITKVQGDGVMYNRISCCVYGAGCQSSVNGKSASISINCSASNATNFTVNITED